MEHTQSLKDCPACQDDSSLAAHLYDEVARLKSEKAAMDAALRTSSYSYHVRDHNHLGVDFENCTLYQCVEARAALSGEGKGE